MRLSFEHVALPASQGDPFCFTRPWQVYVGTRCICHDGGLPRFVIAVDERYRRFCCTYQGDVQAGSKSWHWFDEAAWITHRKVEVVDNEVEPETHNKYGEVAP